MEAEKTWTQVDEYLAGLLLPLDPVLDAALAASDAAGLPAIGVAPNQGKMLHLLVRATGARRVLEIGTLGGYSTIWLARGLPADGRLVLPAEVGGKTAGGVGGPGRHAGIRTAPRGGRWRGAASSSNLADRATGDERVRGIQADRVEQCGFVGPRAADTLKVLAGSRGK